MRQDYEEIRDFLVLHYCTTQRDDTPFWRWCQQMPLPEKLKAKLELFKVHGGLIPGTEELFQPTSWYAVFDGMGVEPIGYNPTLDAIDYHKLKQSLHSGKTAIQTSAATQPSHDEFLRTYCPAPKI